MMDEEHKSADIGNEESVTSAKRKAKRRLEIQQNDLRKLIEMPEFRRYIWRHMNETCGLLRSPASGNGSVQSQNIGMQDAARLMWADLENVDPKVIPLMMIEYAEAQK